MKISLVDTHLALALRYLQGGYRMYTTPSAQATFWTST